MFSGFLTDSIIGRGIREKKFEVKLYNIRDYTTDKHKTADDRVFGGGPGMVLKAEPILKAVRKIKGKSEKKKFVIYMMSPRGEKFTQEVAIKINDRYSDVIIICGRYEGIDSRVEEILQAELLSIGDFILTGGELSAMVIVDVIARLVPGVLGHEGSNEMQREASPKIYTRPAVITFEKKKYEVPKVLLDGHHALIENWRKEENEKKPLFGKKKV